jgi:flagellar biosynthetic protein FliR
MDPLTYTTNQIQLFLMAFVRIASIMALLPIFGSTSIPIYLKSALSLIICFILFPLIQQNATIAPPQTTGIFIYRLLCEIFVGLVIGFIATLLFLGVQFAGYIIDVLTGFSFVELIDPFTESTVTIFGQLNVLIFSIVFLLLNGHYFLLMAIQKSFEIIPVYGATLMSGKLAAFITQQTAQLFIIAFKLSAPIFVTLMITMVALSIVARTVPQINVFFVGIPLNIAVAFGTAIIVLPNLVTIFKGIVDKLMQDIWRLLFLLS